MGSALFLECVALSHTLPSAGAVCKVPVSCSAVRVQIPNLLPCSAVTLLSHLCPQIQGLLILAVLIPLPCCGTITDPMHTSEFCFPALVECP